MVPSLLASYLRAMPIQRLVVVSDAHLGAASAAVEAGLLRFLDAVPDLGDGLLLNGDIFGFWFSYRRAIPRAGVRVLARLEALARTMPVLMTGGNHDRWGAGDSFWEPELGIRFAAHELRFSLGGATVLALHGDGLAAPSWTASLQQRVISHPLTSLGFRALPAELGFWLADRVGGRLVPSERRARLEDETAALQRAWAERRLREGQDLSLLVLGHSHKAVALELFPGRRYLNPGAWFDGSRYAVATENSLALKQFPG
jgi:UDP-2,3-diacylglucosamine hydrolase